MVAHGATAIIDEYITCPITTEVDVDHYLLRLEMISRAAPLTPRWSQFEVRVQEIAPTVGLRSLAGDVGRDAASWKEEGHDVRAVPEGRIHPSTIAVTD
jgi:hypothetical protein